MEFLHSRVILKVMFVSLKFKLEFENKQYRERVLSLMRLQSSMIRFIYNRLKEGKKKQRFTSLLKRPSNSPLGIYHPLSKRLSPYQRAGFGRTIPRENTG